MTSKEFDQRELRWYAAALLHFKEFDRGDCVCSVLCTVTFDFRGIWMKPGVNSQDILPTLHTQRTTTGSNYWFKGSEERVIALKASIKILKEKLYEQ